MVAVVVPAASSPTLPINGGKAFHRSRPSSLSFNHRWSFAVVQSDDNSVASRTKSQVSRISATPNVSGSGYTKSEVIMVDPTEAKRLAAKQMVEIRRKEKLERRKEIEAINGAWAMIGLTAGLVIEGYTGKSILEQVKPAFVVVRLALELLDERRRIQELAGTGVQEVSSAVARPSEVSTCRRTCNYCLEIHGQRLIAIAPTMELKKEKLVRFHQEGKQRKGFPWRKGDAVYPENPSSSSSSLVNPRRQLEKSKVFSEEEYRPWHARMLDPGSDIVLRWNRIFLVSCLMALFIDPLYFYLPTITGKDDEASSCVDTDHKLRIVVTFFRTVADIFYLLHVVLKFRTAYVAPSSRVFGRGELVMDPKLIARSRNEMSLQIVVWFIIPATRKPRTDDNNNALALIVLLQYIPRLYLIFPLSSQIIKATGLVTRTAWAGAAYNLLLYMLASHVLGASWYLLSVERHTTCWKSICRNETSPVKCELHYLACNAFNQDDRRIWAKNTSVFQNCDPSNKIEFQHGLFENAVTKRVVSTCFMDKYLYCLWWGLQQLRQTYLQSLTVRLEEWRLKRRDTEEWMKHRQLPEDLRHRVRRFVQYKWVATRGVHEDDILRGLPTDLRRDIQRHLCLDLVRRVPFFSQMDDQLLDAICERLVSCLSTQGTYIVREGDPVTEMLFIIRGSLESSTTNGGRTGFFNSIMLKPGDFCGEELLAWALQPKSSLNLPSSTRTVRALNEVEAFALRAEDLRFVANQFRRLHSKKLQHTFRYHSHHWRSWAACFIQAAWRRHKKRLVEHSLTMSESFHMNAQLLEEGASLNAAASSHRAKVNLGVTMLASRFAANTRRGVQKMKEVDAPKLQKPEEPDFSADADADAD
ncbi:Cyclic nucleotide-gated ion channel 17 [Linum grandiflorum]